MRICWHSFGSRSQAESGTQANSAGSDQQDHKHAALKRRSFLTVSENVTWVRMELILAVASFTE
jgi:hypothetical protein